MDSECADAKTTVSDDATWIPAVVRRELDVDDGDRLRWTVDGDGSVRVEVLPQESETFADFEGYEGTVDSNCVEEHDEWGIER